MNAWFRQLEALGISSVRLHLLEVDDESIRADCALTDDENIAALTNFCDLETRELATLRFDLFREMRQLLTGNDSKATCIWRACDPLTTRAVRGIEGNGQLSNCGRTNKEGIDFVKSDAPGFERYLALYGTPQEEGGCEGCRFFLMCKGQCPGTAMDGDWRNRTEHCAVWMALFTKLESELLEKGEIPLSTSPLRRLVEEDMLGHWAGGRNPSIEHVLAQRLKRRQAHSARAE